MLNIKAKQKFLFYTKGKLCRLKGKSRDRFEGSASLFGACMPILFAYIHPNVRNHHWGRWGKGSKSPKSTSAHW